jgi:hypothetical protein
MTDPTVVADQAKPVVVTGARGKGKAPSTTADPLPIHHLIVDRVMSPQGYSFVIVLIVAIGGIVMACTRADAKDALEVLKIFVLPVVTLFLGFLIGQGTKWR